MAARSLLFLAAFLLTNTVSAETVPNATVVKLADGNLTVKLANGRQVTLPVSGTFTAHAAKQPGARPEQVRDADRLRLLAPGNVITFKTGQTKKVTSVLDVTLVRGSLANDEVFDALLAANPDLLPKKETAKLNANRTKAEAEQSSTAAFLRGEDDPNTPVAKRPPRSSPAKVIEGSVAKVERGKITIKPTSGEEVTYSVGLNLVGIDLEGKEYEGPFAARLLSSDNVLKFGIGNVLGKESIVELRLVRGSVAELKPQKPEPSSIVFEGTIRPADWERYYKTAQVGDYVEYRDPDNANAPPARYEIMEVGKDYVVESRIVYFFGVAGTEARYKLKYDPRQKMPKQNERGKQVTATVAGQERPCQYIEERKSGANSDIYHRRLYCPEIPFDGLAREQLHGKLQKEVVGFKWGAKAKG